MNVKYRKSRTAFSLVELVVVIMILGILAAVAAPKLLQTSGDATDNGVKQTLAVVRDAIEMYAASNGGALPGADGVELTFKTDLETHLRGNFPKCPVGNKNDQVFITTADTDIAGGAGTGEGWHYCNQNGQFIINSASTDSGGTSYDAY